MEAVGHGPEAEAIRRQLGASPNVFQAILVGKDGGPKLVSPPPLTAERLFPEIDAMPMRADEMRRGGR